MSMTYDSDSGRLTFLKETACSPEWLHATTGKLYMYIATTVCSIVNSLHVSYESVQ